MGLQYQVMPSSVQTQKVLFIFLTSRLPMSLSLIHILLRGGDVVRPEAEQIKGGEVRQFPERSHSGEVLQVSRRAPEPVSYTHLSLLLSFHWKYSSARAIAVLS